MVQAIILRPFIAEARVRVRVSPCEICAEKSGSGTGIFSEFFSFPLPVSFNQGPILIHHLRDEQQASWWPQFRDMITPSRN
jgi:hypothetical protein